MDGVLQSYLSLDVQRELTAVDGGTSAAFFRTLFVHYTVDGMDGVMDMDVK